MAPDGGGGQEEFQSPSPSSPPARGGEIFEGLSVNVTEKIQNHKQNGLGH